MTRHQPIIDPLHHESWELLPWYVNGTLTGQELAHVEQHLVACTACQEEVRRWRHIAAATRLTEERVPPPSAVGFARVMASIDAMEANGQQAPNGLGILWHWIRSVTTMLQQTPRCVRLTLAFEGALVLLLAGVIVWQAQSMPKLYTTLSTPEARSQHVGQIRLIFAEDSRAKELRALLTSVQATIIKGPSQVGAYTVEVPLADPTPASLQTILAVLRGHPRVQLAEPISRH